MLIFHKRLILNLIIIKDQEQVYNLNSNLNDVYSKIN